MAPVGAPRSRALDELGFVEREETHRDDETEAVECHMLAPGCRNCVPFDANPSQLLGARWDMLKPLLFAVRNEFQAQN